MKNCFLTSLVLMSLLYSQEAMSQRSYGVKAGLNVSSIVGENIENVDVRPGIHIGLLGRLKVSERFALQPEIYYSQRGFKSGLNVNNVDPSNFDPTISATAITVDSRFDYVDLPLMAQYKLIEGLTVEAGPQLGFFLSETIKVDGDEINDDQTSSDSFALVEVGILGGLGYYFENGVFFQARYVFGVTNIFDNDVLLLNNESVFNRNVQFSIGYFF